MGNKFLVGIVTDNKQRIGTQPMECNCGIPQLGYKWVFKDVNDIEAYIKMINEMEKKYNELK